jgi:adenylate cyclase
VFKNRAVDVKEVGRLLGVRYVLEGAIKKAGHRVRITCQLAEAATGVHIWSDRFDSELTDIFDLQDEVTRSVLSALEPSLLSAETARTHSKPTESLTAYDLYLRALPEVYAFTPETLQRAEQLLQRAVSLDTRYSDAWAALADCIARQTTNAWISEWDAGRDAGLRAADKAVQADPENGRALSVAGWNYALLARKNQEAVDFARRALRIHPNSAFVQNNCGWVYTYNGEPERARIHFETALRLNPLDPRGYLIFNGLALASIIAGEFEDAERWTRRALDLRAAWPASLRFRAAALAHLGRIEEAQAVIAKLMSIQPNSSVSRAARVGIKDERHQSIMLDGLRRAGLPE